MRCGFVRWVMEGVYLMAFIIALYNVVRIFSACFLRFVDVQKRTKVQMK